MSRLLGCKPTLTDKIYSKRESQCSVLQIDSDARASSSALCIYLSFFRTKNTNSSIFNTAQAFEIYG